MLEALHILLDGRSLTEHEAHRAFSGVLAGDAAEAEIAALLTLIQQRGAAIDELVGAARAMREHVTRVPYTAPPGDVLIDTCGTGGAPKTFNISTIAAIVVAAARGAHRVRVAKHGNRSRSGRGSAEVLAALGVNVDAPPDVQARCLDEAGVCFCFAIHHHPATRHAAPVRRALGFPTIFNLLGPLTNPALAPRQLLGVYDERFVEPMAHALARLGAERAMVVHGLDGMDEITTTMRTRTATVEGGQVRPGEVHPADVGLPTAAAHDLTAATLEDAARIFREVLAAEYGPRQDIVALNAAAALHVAGAAPTLESALRLAREAITSGEAARTLQTLIRASGA